MFAEQLLGLLQGLAVVANLQIVCGGSAFGLGLAGELISISIPREHSP